MVTKLVGSGMFTPLCYILAKNHMVTKHPCAIEHRAVCYILAKNHMVTKLMTIS